MRNGKFRIRYIKVLYLEGFALMDDFEKKETWLA